VAVSFLRVGYTSAYDGSWHVNVDFDMRCGRVGGFERGYCGDDRGGVRRVVGVWWELSEVIGYCEGLMGNLIIAFEFGCLLAGVEQRSTLSFFRLDN
jgi:hypothetical protein